jgi:hypothetical protein
MFEVVVAGRHDHADDDVDDEQQDANRAPHARLFTLSPSTDAICSMPGMQVQVAEAVGWWLSLRAWGNPRGRRLR